ncbi:receptor like protein kinase S.2-like [Lolium rigidum]|uniref:receptor like protein kinase S.2-like n=1 Tax=Lolium rigidum TaxID=89674 RepID=UPI001F5DBF15|nr:receptor like protein kinase S.2-like [Lolium rigidum]
MASKLQNAASLTIRGLQQITDNFSEERKIGQGAYGTVYKGVRANGEKIAVKLLHNKMPGTDDEEFNREFQNLMRLEHHNVVRLVSYCYDTQHKARLHEGKTIFVEEIHRALCFEFMGNGSLAKYITEEDDGLDWDMRYRIIKGSCEGQHYLHEGSEQPIYHLDLKPDNILLDENMMPKLADFGLSKFFDGELTMTATSVIGTRGYMPPEYLFGRKVTKKFDIFSLGVIMTKIIAGPEGPSRRDEMSYMKFIDQVQRKWRNRLRKKWHASRPLQAYCQQVKTCIEIAVCCMETDRNKRPSILEIIQKLNETESLVEEFKNDRSDHGRTRVHRTTRGKSQDEVMTLSTKTSEATELTQLTIRQLQKMTDNFSEDRKIGKGTYGEVYRGLQNNGEEIAVKLIRNGSHAETDTRFQREFENLMMLNHQNIVPLAGYCYETQREPIEYKGKKKFVHKEYRALCFQYMKNGSLQKHLSDELHGLDWQTRYEIIKQICKGLEYLHEGLEEPLYHLDLKPDNILLDENMLPKLTGFGGLSPLYDSKETMVTEDSTGTLGYLPPEFLSKKIISTKFDIFSLGVVMTKIIAGPGGPAKYSEMARQEFIDQVCENWRNMLATWSSSWPLEAYCKQVKICTRIALSCMDDDRHKRPSIVDIIDKLNETETEIDKAFLWMHGDLVKLNAFSRSEAIPFAETCNKFPILVEIMVPAWCLQEEMPRAGVDVVLVFGINRTVSSRSTVNDIKEAMAIAIDKLGQNDRLSIVLLGTHSQRLMELTYMSKQGQDVARLKIKGLVAEHAKNVGAGLLEGAQILRGREVEKGNSRVGCIMFLSHGDDEAILTQEISSEFPVHTFGLQGHDPEVMKYIADKTSGTYSFLNQLDMYEMKDALELFLTSIRKVTATTVKITLEAREGVTISSIESGGYSNHVSSDKRSGEIYTHDIYAGERKNFVVYLDVAEGEENLMTIGCQYQSLDMRRELAATDVSVLRPRQECSAGELVIHREVALELARIRLAKGLSALIAHGRRLTLYDMEQLWDDRVSLSMEGHGTHSETLSDLGKDMAEITKYTSYQYRNPKKVPYIQSWLSSHKWQRATTKGSCTDSNAFNLAQLSISGQDEDHPN